MSRGRRWIVYLSILALFVGAGAWVFLHLGEWLVVEDPLMTAHAIVVLSGGMPDRALEAARLYHQNAAAQVWVSQPVSPAVEMAQMNIAFVGEDFYNQRVLMAQGVPSDAIRLVQGPSANTEEEVQAIARDSRRDQDRKLIVVTSKPHTRRVRLIWHRLVGEAPQLIIRYVRDDKFDAGHWWRNTQDALDVVREWLGIANAWLGFPAQPRRAQDEPTFSLQEVRP